MAHLVSAVALSHSPLINHAPPPGEAAQIQRFRSFAAKLGEHVRASRPDVLVVVGQDHLRTLFYNLMPAFCIGTGRVDSWGDWGTYQGPLETAPHVARHLHRALLSNGFDPACSYDLRIDHGIMSPLELMDLATQAPVVPILVNTGAPPLPTPRRCYEFGRALAAAVRDYPQNIRVALIGSGGISHAPPMPDVESDDPKDAEAVNILIHGAASVAAREKARVAGLLARATAGKFENSVRPEWDRMVLQRLAQGNVAAFADELDEASINRDGGCGGQEIRTWLTIAGATGGAPMEIVGYEPINFLITGMAGARAL